MTQLVAVVATAQLLAVFVPVAVPGITGRIYSQFATVISNTVSISSINALSPALCSPLLRKSPQNAVILWLV